MVVSRLGCRALARARIAGTMRVRATRTNVSSFTSSSVLMLPFTLGSLRTLSVSAWRASQSESEHVQQSPQTSVPTGPLNMHLSPSNMLEYLNSENFSAYRSSSNPSTALFGLDEGLAATALTHESWMHGSQVHNRRLAFLGALRHFLANDRPSCSENVHVFVPVRLSFTE